MTTTDQHTNTTAGTGHPARRVRRGRRHITCDRCGQETITRHPETHLCRWCRTALGVTTDPAPEYPAAALPVTQRSKHDLDAWLAAGGDR